MRTARLFSGAFPSCDIVPPAFDDRAHVVGHFALEMYVLPGRRMDEAEAAGTDIVDAPRDGEPVVYDAESTDVSDEDSSKT